MGAPTAVSYPEIGRFRVSGGATITPEFMALLFGLTIYTSAFIAEIVRAGILSVPKGQIEAGRSLGLRESVIMRKVILPQALRVIIPPLTSQYLNLTKNSSLAVAVGYPDLVSVSNTTLNQTGQAPEAILIMMIVYLTTSIAHVAAHELVQLAHPAGGEVEPWRALHCHRPAQVGPIAWARENLFNGIGNSHDDDRDLSALLAYVLPMLYTWAVSEAVLTLKPSSDELVGLRIRAQRQKLPDRARAPAGTSSPRSSACSSSGFIRRIGAVAADTDDAAACSP